MTVRSEQLLRGITLGDKEIRTGEGHKEYVLPYERTNWTGTSRQRPSRMVLGFVQADAQQLSKSSHQPLGLHSFYNQHHLYAEGLQP